MIYPYLRATGVQGEGARSDYPLRIYKKGVAKKRCRLSASHTDNFSVVEIVAQFLLLVVRDFVVPS
jgi:hypothetical protein